MIDLRAGAPLNIKPIYISYSHADRSFTARLANALDAKHVRYWHDVRDATSGRVDEVLERAISLHPTALVVLSKTSLESGWVEFELATAIERGSKLCPIAIDDTWKQSKSLSGDIRVQLKKHMMLDFSDARLFDQRFDQLWRGIKQFYGEEPSDPVSWCGMTRCIAPCFGSWSACFGLRFRRLPRY